MHATLADRDKITADDNVQLLLGTFHDRRQAYVFAVNPFGVQMDGTIVEAGTRATRRLDADAVRPRRARPEPGLRLHVEGTADRVRLRGRDSHSVQESQIPVGRRAELGHQRRPSRCSTRATRIPGRRPSGRTRRSSRSRARSTDLRGFDRGLVLDLNPVVTRKATGAPSRERVGRTRTRVRRSAATCAAGMTNNLTLNGTANPDFAEVESDAGQFVIDPRQALFFPEKRPFFLEGLEQFNAPHESRSTRVASRKPDAALEAHGQGRRYERRFPLGERRSVAVAERARRDTYYNILRAQRDIGDAIAHRHGVHRSRRRRATTIASPTSTAASLFGDVYSGSFQYAESYDKTRRRRDECAALWSGILARNGKQFGFRYTMTGIDERFPRAQRLHLAPGHRARRDRPSRDVVQRARVDRRDADRRHSVRRHLAVLAPPASRRRAGQEVPPQHERRSARRLDGGRRRVLGDVRLGLAAVSQLSIERTVGHEGRHAFRSSASGAFPNRDYVLTLDDAAVVAVRRRRCSTSAARTRTSSSGRRRTSTTCR